MTARSWNGTTPDAAIRLERGTASFLAEASDSLQKIITGSIYSPALYKSATRAWVRASYQPFVDLTVMERRMTDIGDRSGETSVSASPDMEVIESLDRAAFDSFWHMGAAGLVEALGATPISAVLETYQQDQLAGYAIVGCQMATAYLQRIATHPRYRGRGLGKALIVDSLHWGRAAGAASLVLNVKPDNSGAIHLYRAMGFVEPGTRLHVLRYPG